MQRRRIAGRRTRQNGSSKRLFYWILAKDPDTGRPFLIKGDYDETVARSKAFEMLGGIDFEIKGLRTTNIEEASRQIRGHRLEDTHSLKEASRRIGHEKSVHRMRRRRNFI